MENKKIMKWLLFLLILTCSISLSGQVTKYKVEYSIENNLPVFPNDDTNDDDVSELRIRFASSNFVIYNEAATFPTNEDNGVLTVVDRVVTLDNLETQLTSYFNSYCPYNGYQPVNRTHSINECGAKSILPFTSLGGCANLVENYGRITRISSEAFGSEPAYNFSSLNPEKTPKFCEETTLVTPFCTVGNYALELEIDGTTTHTILDYGTHPGEYVFNPSTITGVNSNSVIHFIIYYTEDKTESDITIYTINACPPELDSTPEVLSNVLCNGGNQGTVLLDFDKEPTATEKLQITFTRDSESEPFTVETLLAGDFVNTTYTQSGLTAGDYSIEWSLGDIDETDENQFVTAGPATFTVTEPEALGYSLVSTTRVQCNANGAIDITPSGGSENYNYEWSGPDGATTIVSTEQDLSTDTPGEYILRLFDAAVTNGSCSIVSNSINIADPPENPTITILPSTQQPSSENGGKGTIGISASGTNPISYSWLKDGNPFTPSSDTFLTNLDPGTYTVTVTDANGCSSSQDIIMEALPPISVSIDQATPINCVGETTTLTANVINGTGSYLWSTNETTETIEVGPGTYTVTVTDTQDNTNTATSPAYIVQYVDQNDNPITEVLAVTATKLNDVLCKGEATGRISLNITGGVSPYQVFWDNALSEGPADNAALSVGNHSYEVIDGNGCSLSGGPIFIDEPADNPVISVDFQSDVTTNNGSDGRITVSVQGGTTPYTYSWVKDNAPFVPSSDTDLMNLTAGVYELTLRDNSGIVNSCEVIETMTIDQPGPLQINNPPATITDVGCFGESTGRIDASYVGTPNFEFVWFDEVGTELKRGQDDFIENLPEGTYSYTINDASNAGPLSSIDIGAIEIVQPTAPLAANLTQTEVTCFGDANGTITVAAVGGTAPIQYTISGGVALQPTPGSFTNLAAGTYTITVTDANGCTTAMPLSTTLLPPDPITFDDTNAVTPVSTPGGSDGSISVTVQGGVQPYFYRWTAPGILTPINTTNTTTIENLSVGVYTLEVSNKATFDIDGCYFTRSYTVAEQATASVTITNQQNPCFGQTNGSITAAVAGTGPYTLQWSEALLGDLVGETELTLSNIGEGTYTLNVIDNGSVPAAVGDSPAVVLIEPQVITADTNTTASCAANGSGTITISNVQGGEPGNPQNYTYSIDGTTFQNNPLFENLIAQTYSVWVRDGNGCDGIFSGVTVAPSPAIVWDEPNTIVTNATAQGASDGTITLAFTSDATNYTYNWNGPATNNETTQNLAGKAAGVYTVIVTNENGCTLERIFTIAEPGILTITVNSTKNPCFGENNGNIQTTVVGTGNLSYQWSEAVLGDLAGETGPNLNNVPEGTYTLTVTDDAVNPPNVVSSNPITLSDPSVALDAQATPTDAQCAGVSDGMVTITASGGIPPYEYSIDGGANYQPGATFNNLGLGSYSFRVRDSNQCVADATATINEPPAIALSFVATPLSAAGAADGAIDIAASGGTGDLNFSWVGPAGFTSTTDEDISGLTAGDYTVTVTDENGCSFISNPITIDEPGAIIITLTLNEEILCNGDEFGEILADVQGGVPDYTYQWFQEGNNTPLGETTNLISNLGAGNYFLRVTDANGISRDSSILPITEPAVLQVALQNKVDIVCSGEASGSINITVQGGTAPYSFQWNNGADAQNLANIEAGDYFVEVFDDNGCFELLEVTINPAPNALQLDATVTNVSEYLANDGSVTLDITGGATPYAINWTRDSDNTPAGNTATITALSADSYTVTVSDANGCNISETYEVTQPDIVEDTIVQPSCQGDSNGSISVLVNQGNGTFTYLWNTGETTNAISNLGAGDYTVTITGFGNGPLTRSYTLVDPLPLEVDLGQDRVLCADQVLELDATVEDDTATYTWTSDTGFSSSNPQVTLTTTGNYTVTVQTASGCTAVGTLSLEVSTDEIDAEFAMSSQVFIGDILVAVDISFPLPDTIEWVVPDGATIVKQDSDEAEFIFNQAGEYEIGIITVRGDCIAQKTKKVLVVAQDGSVNEDEGNDANKQVEDFILYPNPTTGRFTADVSLTEPGNISIKVFSFANNALIASERGRGEASYSIPFDISGMPSGVYAVLLETPYGTSLRKIVVR